MSRRNSIDRLVFSRPGAQRKFIIQAKEKLGLDWEELAVLVDAHPRSVRDWAREKYNMAYTSAKLIEQHSNLHIPQRTRIKTWQEHGAAAGHFGGLALVKKYGRVAINEEYRQKKWLEWWNKKGKYLEHSIENQPLPFRVPPISKKLAEFVGIMLGDGCVTKYQLSITLHRYDDAPYSLFVRQLIRELFHIDPGTRRHKESLADDIVISRIKLVEHAVKNLGMVVGNKVKQQVNIPQWIKNNKQFSIACVRGLVDTDGSVFTHRYKVNGKEYAYKKLSYTSFSNPLLLSVYDILSNLGIKVRLAVSLGKSDVRIDSIEDMRRYFQIVGSSNPKHLKRYSQ